MKNMNIELESQPFLKFSFKKEKREMHQQHSIFQHFKMFSILNILSLFLEDFKKMNGFKHLQDS